MIIKSLLFIIVCIFCYETYKNMNKMTEEYFIQVYPDKNTHANTNAKEKFIQITGNPGYDSIASTIRINCNAYPSESTKIMSYKPEPNDVLDTPYYSQFKPIEYNAKRNYFWKRNKLIEEGIRRSKDDTIELAKVQSLFDNEKDDDVKQNYKDELNLFTWKKNIFEMNDKLTGISREKRDIITDYYPDEIGLQRPWIERHSHIPDYSY
jgi:hypothetical protein